ncbi:MAG: bifunctional DNA-formamidopyrimidine glycosylase/DNA-(apurinic or apyrimidinic site) lyase [Oceanibaculum nanhaiense]|uniref:bifunctional DNA-formamidopyrimidine glycosylase/DNA-(apurinic or apyrimidinic site) lyase n=1 Tax=Oceanibaculum nanhaiense TaxID=1909734 RepID=UPI0025A3B821|nr:bifunctional DNA-formamidopyrimidine glycosylase/DNA-(apurinic or apyrimidinic site) lyase [Oceanibaculum nanhaiense]MDM7945913.1 bifunctional DNA-formamidopyrimidine glycosylase/DNA-(apurinic or apyrimidinic site) lyase [Oceanibaculum nanhaiense]
MPELPEVETVRRGLAPHLEGRRLVHVEARRPDLRWPLPVDFAQRLQDRTVVALRRRAKYLLAELEDGTVLIAHLGMSGRMLITHGQPPALEKHDHIVLATDRDVWIRFNDARRFGAMDLTTLDALDTHKLLAGLGPEPLSNAFNGPALAAALAGRRTPIKAALLDQHVVAGIGNIYACEALYRSGLSPRRLAHTVQGGRAERLATAVKQVLAEAIEAGGSTLRDYRQADGELGYFQHAFKVYGREGEACRAPDCGRPLRRLVQSGRSTFYCATCQR